MYPNLSYILHALFGAEPDNAFSIVQTFGLFLVFSFLAAAYFFKKELRRKADEGLFQPTYVDVSAKQPFAWFDNIINGFILGLIAMKTTHIALNYETFQKDPSGFLLTADGPWLILLVVLGVFTFVRYNAWKKIKHSERPAQRVAVYPHDRVGDITVIAAFSGIFGSKLFSVMEDLPGFFQNPVGSFFSGSGLNIYGGLIVGFLAVYYYIRKHNIEPLHVMDAIAPALIISYGVGRMGCQFSGDGDWGIVNNNPVPSWWILPDSWWASTYPHNVIDDGVSIAGCTWQHCMQLAQPVYPTPIYEIIASIVIFLILWALRKRVKVPGVLFFIYMILNGVERFWIEKIRINDKYSFMGLNMTQAEYIAVLYIIVAIGCIIYFTRKHQSKNGANV